MTIIELLEELNRNPEGQEPLKNAKGTKNPLRDRGKPGGNPFHDSGGRGGKEQTV